MSDESFRAWAAENVEPTTKPEQSKEKYADIIECVAITMAIGNSGGEWNINYTEDQRILWRKRAKAVVRYVIDETQALRSK